MSAEDCTGCAERKHTDFTAMKHDGNTAREQAKLFAEDLDKTYGKVYEKVIGALERRHIDGWTDEDPSKLRQKSKPQN